MPYNESMTMKTASVTMPVGFTEELTTLHRSRQDINFQTIIKSDSGDRTLRGYIRRDAYDDQSYGGVQLFTPTGWVDVFRVNINELPNSKEISYISVPQETTHVLYEEKQEIVSELMMQDCLQMFRTALSIVR
jgi:hypothetical protein